jgi:hypothetical protein
MDRVWRWRGFACGIRQSHFRTYGAVVRVVGQSTNSWNHALRGLLTVESKTSLYIFEGTQDDFEENQSSRASIVGTRIRFETNSKGTQQMSRQHYTLEWLAPALAFVIIILAAGQGNAQSNSRPLTFRSGQSMYIVAFRLQFPVVWDETQGDRQREYINNDLDAERKIRKRIEEWNYFKVAEKLSDADFVFLVSLDENSIEGLAIPIDAYRQHFKDKFDLDALRDAAIGRFLIGPLKLPTLSRLSDRLVQQFREKIAP